MKTKLVRPVIVETKEKSTFKGQLCLNGIYLFSARESDNVGNLNPQQLILISLEDEKIEVGDLVYDTLKNRLFNAMSNYDGMKYIHKVIATQDQIYPEYIAKFVEQYNNGKVEDIEIEIEDIKVINNLNKDIPSIHSDYKPKLTNGFITIVNKKPILYTEEEVYELFNSFRKDFSLYRGIQIMDEQLKGWFNRNKKKQ